MCGFIRVINWPIQISMHWFNSSPQICFLLVSAPFENENAYLLLTAGSTGGDCLSPPAQILFSFFLAPHPCEFYAGTTAATFCRLIVSLSFNPSQLHSALLRYPNTVGCDLSYMCHLFLPSLCSPSQQ